MKPRISWSECRPDVKARISWGERCPDAKPPISRGECRPDLKVQAETTKPFGLHTRDAFQPVRALYIQPGRFSAGRATRST
ncbi:MAG: hypothetical protein IT323_04185 [Anaerolineae bacterium]|nr:hypothetical protein [Anaerolineae bacterium]